MLVGIFGDENASSGEQGNEGGEGDEGGETSVPEGTIVASFDGTPSVANMFTVGGSYGDGKINYNGTSYKKGVKLDSKGSIVFTPAKNYNMSIVLATAKPGRNVKLNGKVTTVAGEENTAGAYYQLQPVVIEKGIECKLEKGSGESIVMLLILEPVE
jgi:hypothetical protein